MKKRVLSLLMALCLMLTLLPATALGVENDPQTEPVVTEPVVTEPVDPEPVVTEPVDPEPVVTEPVVTEPVVTEPVVTEPVVTEPVVTEPVVTEPVVAEPVVTEPVVTEPVVTEPVVTEPVVTEPVVAEPLDPVCNCGATADETGAVTHLDTCPLYEAISPMSLEAGPSGGKITNLEAATLDAVFGAGNYTLADTTITLNNSITIGNTIEVPASVTCTIDLNGQTLSYTADTVDALNEKGVLTVTGGTLTIDDTSEQKQGKIAVTLTGTTTNNQDAYAVVVTDGKLILDGGTISMDGSAMTAGTYHPDYSSETSYYHTNLYGISVTSAGSVSITGGSVSAVGNGEPEMPGTGIDSDSNSPITISGGTIFGDDYGVKHDGSGSLSMSGTAEIKSDTVALYLNHASASHSITGGTIKGTGMWGVWLSDGTLTVSGGTFSAREGDYAIHAEGTLVLSGTPTISQGLVRLGENPIQLAAKLTGSTIPVLRPYAKQGDIVAKSDGDYIITQADVGQLTYQDNWEKNFSLELSGTGTAGVVKAVAGKYTVRYGATMCKYVTMSGFESDKTKAVDVGTNFTTTITPDANHSLPKTIKVSAKSTYLVLGTDYTYDSTTGELVLKGSSSHLTAGAVIDLEINGSIATAENLQAVLGGDSVAKIDGNTVTLTQNATIAAGEFLNIEAKNLTLDLGGKTLTLGKTVWFNILTGGGLTLKNGSVTDQETTRGIENHGGTLTIESGSIGCDVAIFDGTTTITGGTFSSAVLTYPDDRAPILTVNGGTFNLGIEHYIGTLTINGGDIQGTDEYAGLVAYGTKEKAPTIVKAGTFSQFTGNSQTLADCIASGSKVYKYDGGTKGVQLTGDALKVTSYATPFIVEAPPAPTEKTATPIPAFAIEAASSTDTASFTIINKADYQGKTVTCKLYTSATGNDVKDGMAATLSGPYLKISNVKASGDYWVSATEDGKLESERVQISVRPKWKTYDAEISTPEELAEYLNYCEPDAASVSGSTVTQKKDVIWLHSADFVNDFNGTWDMGTHKITVPSNYPIYLDSSDAANVKLTLKGGTIRTPYSGVKMKAGEVTVEGTKFLSNNIPLYVVGGKITLTDVTAKVMKGADAQGKYAIYVAPGANVSIVSGKFISEYTNGYTYIGEPSESEKNGKTLASCIAAGSISTPANSTVLSENGYNFQVCTETITVTKAGEKTPQQKVDEAFGPGNATFVSPNTIKIIKDTVLDSTITIGEDVTIDLSGKHLSVKDGAENQDGKPAFTITDGTLTITGPGSITGGKGTGSGNGGSAITGTGNGSVVINGGAAILGGSGMTGGTGAKTENGSITVDQGATVSGGNGSNSDGTNAGGTGGVGTSTGAGDTTVNGTVTGGSGGDGSGTQDGGAGGAGVNESGAISGNGTIHGGNGGNIPDGGTGSVGAGGAAITGSGAFGGTTNAGSNGVKANATVNAANAGTTVTAPEKDLVDGAVTDTERTDKTIEKIDVTLTVEKKDDKPDADEVERAKPEGSTVVLYLDIKLEKVIMKTDNSTENETVTKATKPITITITIPKDLRGGSNYKIIRVHNGVVETITPRHDSVKNTLSFETDKFSTYAIAYTPKNEPTPPPYVPDDDDDDDAPSIKPEISQSVGGSAAISPENPKTGDQVNITAKPDKGKLVDKIVVTDKDGKEVLVTKNPDGTYTFTQPVGKVKITVTFQPAPLPFTDVPTDAYYKDAVAWAYENGITGGASAATFNPNGICTRAQAVTFLWRAMGSPEPTSTTCSFTDVKQGTYYDKAVLWAAEKGITKGTSATTFTPNALVTRGQAAAFLWRTAGAPAAAKAHAFVDVDNAAYYYDAVLWAAEQNITGGTSATSATTFSPANPCSRAQLVTFLYRYLSE